MLVEAVEQVVAPRKMRVASIGDIPDTRKHGGRCEMLDTIESYSDALCNIYKGHIAVVPFSDGLSIAW